MNMADATDMPNLISLISQAILTLFNPCACFSVVLFAQREPE
jgi:hypothetical protein